MESKKRTLEKDEWHDLEARCADADGDEWVLGKAQVMNSFNFCNHFIFCFLNLVNSINSSMK
jgi:hypothetical protein